MNYKRGNPGCCTCGSTHAICGCSAVPDTITFTFSYYQVGGTAGPITWSMPWNSSTSRYESAVTPMPGGFVWTGGVGGCTNGQVFLTPGSPCVASFALTDGSGAICFTSGHAEVMRQSGITCSPFLLGVTQSSDTHPVVFVGHYSG
jgi:hypothetical protein